MHLLPSFQLINEIFSIEDLIKGNLLFFSLIKARYDFALMEIWNQYTGKTL